MDTYLTFGIFEGYNSSGVPEWLTYDSPVDHFELSPHRNLNNPTYQNAWKLKVIVRNEPL